MKNKIYIFIVIFFMVLIAVSIVFLLSAKTEERLSISPNPEKVLEECQTLSYSGEGSINLVFFASKSEAQRYSDYFFGIKPFEQNKDNLNIYYIPDYQPECELYKDIAILCYSKELIKKASSCPNDYLIVLKQQPSGIRSSAYMNILSLNSRHPLSVLPHEMGHAIANLAEEYAPAELPKGQKNCVSSCEKFEGEIDGCYIGCSKENYQRSIDNGIMRTLSSNEYGIFDESLILERIESKLQNKITGQVIQEQPNCFSEKYYLIEAIYSSQNNTIEVLSQTIEPGCLGGNGYGNFDYAFYNTQDNLILEDSFNPQLIFTDAPGEIQIDGEIYENDGLFMLKMPVISTAKKLEIIHDDKITNINLEGTGARPCKK